MRQYVRDFAKTTCPNDKFFKGKKFEQTTWAIDCHANVEALKEALSEATILQIVHPLKNKLVLCTYANDMTIGVIVMQEGMVIAYESRKLNNAELNYSIHEKKLLAIIHTLKVWSHYLLGSEFKIETGY